MAPGAVMAEQLLSTLWYRVADLKPKLRSHATMHRHRYRGQLWYLLRDGASGRVNRFTASARLVISLMDGTHSVADLWSIANRRLGEAAPTQDEMVHLLGQLHAADLLQSDVTPDVAELFARGEKAERNRQRQSFGNPMAIRVPLWDPDSFLDRFPGLIGLIWSRWGAALWLAVCLPALALIPLHWPELSNNFSDRVLAVDNLLILYLVFPLLKLCHEMGHASATKAGGGEVHDLGLIFLVLLPVPYVEASASTVFRSKYRRATVGAAGVIVELFIAALAFYLWLAVEPGPVRAVLYNIMIIAGVSTLLFNGNPLLRYDAYYILSDLTEIPNLSARATRYWTYLLERYVLGAKELNPPDGTRAEKTWLLCYGAASSVYRVLVTIVIALFIATRFFFIGVLLAFWAVAVMAGVPVLRAFRHLASSPRLRGHRVRAVVVTIGTLAGLAAILLYVPVPHHTNVEGIIWLQEEALVRAGADGFLADILTEPGTPVAKGQALLRLTNPALTARLRLAQAQLAEFEATRAVELVSDRTKAAVTWQKVLWQKSQLAVNELQTSELTVPALTDGVFVLPQRRDLEGRYYHRGDLLGYVIGEAQPLVRVAVSQDAIDQVRIGTATVRLRLVDHPEIPVTGRIIRAIPGGDEYLPSRALSVEGGGQIATDPRETKGPKAMQRMFQFDVQLDTGQRMTQFGQRVYVRFEHRGEPLAVQWFRSVRLLFLSRFSV